MRLGVVIPRTESGADPGAVRDYAQVAESLGHQHVVVIEHVLGAEAANYQGWTALHPYRPVPRALRRAGIPGRLYREY